MVTCIPESPAFTTASERDVWLRLRDALGPDDLLVANLPLITPERDHELDLVVVMPGFGAVVLEVKGGSVWYDDGWCQARDGHAEWIDPVAQARNGKYALRSLVEDHPAWGSRTRIRWSHGVITPYSAFPADFAVTDLPRWALHDRDQLQHLVTRLRANASRGLDVTSIAGGRVPDADDVDTLVEILTARGNATAYDVNAEAAERAAVADRLTEQQAMVLAVTRHLHRVEVRGGAGSGKTVLALQQARDLTRGAHDRPTQRVALLCYSLGLAAHLRRVVESWPRNHRPAFVGTFHDFGRQWGAPDGDRADSAFWEEQLPSQMAELAAGLPDGKRYDAVVVDEAQDFAETWWTPVLRSLRDEERGGLYVFSDENQRIFGRFGVPPVALVPLVLDHCLRNTWEIHEAFSPLAPSRMYSKGAHGPAVRFVPAAAENAVEVADEEVVRLLDDEGWAPGKVALITTGHRHDSHRDQFEALGQDGYWQTFWDGEEVFYGHVLGCKGLERPAVVLCLNDDPEKMTDRARERLYVGMSRATDELVVVGDPEWVREVGGPAVARKLGL